MTALVYLIPAALLLGGVGLAAFLWTLKSGQYSDLDGAAYRILFDEDDHLGSAEKGDRPGTESLTSQGDNRV